MKINHGQDINVVATLLVDACDGEQTIAKNRKRFAAIGDFRLERFKRSSEATNSFSFNVYQFSHEDQETVDRANCLETLLCICTDLKKIVVTQAQIVNCLKKINFDDEIYNGNVGTVYFLSLLNNEYFLVRFSPGHKEVHLSPIGHIEDPWDGDIFTCPQVMFSKSNFD